MKFVKVMFDTTSGADNNFTYKIDEVNVASNWNPKADNPRDMGGFNYTTEDSILRWLHRGDTIYDVEVPSDAEIIKLEGATTIYRSNKIILSNPRKVNDDMALHFYEISKIPEKSYYKALGVVSIMGYKETADKLIRDKVNENNIDEVLEEWNDFIFRNDKNNRKELTGLVKEVDEILNEIKSDLLISINVNKEPYEKIITNDKVINITGESGSGKSTYTNKYLNDDNYIVIDTDEIRGNNIIVNDKVNEFREYLNNKYDNNIPDICSSFAIIYKEILDYYKDSDKTIVIDSAQFRNLITEEEIGLLKGKIVIIRISVNECYNRVINRFKSNNKNYSNEDLIKYQNKKLGMYKWYKSLNEFIKKIDKLKVKDYN